MLQVILFFYDSILLNQLAIKQAIKLGAVVGSDGRKRNIMRFQFNQVRVGDISLEYPLFGGINYSQIERCKRLHGLIGTDLFCSSNNLSGKPIVLYIKMSDSTLTIENNLVNTLGYYKIESSFKRAGTEIFLAIPICGKKFLFKFDTGCTDDFVIKNSEFKQMPINFLCFDSIYKEYGFIATTISGQVFDTAKHFYTKIPFINRQEIPVNINVNNSNRVNLCGMGFLKHFDMIIDFQNHQVFLKPIFKKSDFNNYLNFYSKYGFSISVGLDGRILIKTLIINGDAVKAGLKIGDEIISVNNIICNQLNPCEVENTISAIDGTPTDNKMVIRRNGELITINL